MKNTLVCLLALICVTLVQAQSVTLNLKNNTDVKVTDYTVEVPVASLKKLPIGNYNATVDGQQVPVEIVSNLKGETKAIFPVAGFEPKETKKVVISSGTASQYPKRSYAELSHKIGGQFEGHVYKGGFSWIKTNYMKVDGDFRDHAYYIKYEGPGWESDRVAFRFYLDQRNAVDVFAKKTPGIVLPQVGVEDYEKYHHMADWGMDNQRVGKALGMGTIAIWNGTDAVRVEKRDSVECYIPADGKIRSQVRTTYYGWDAAGVKCNLQSLISIDAGSRASHMELFVDKKIANLATGINIDPKAEMFVQNEKGSEWSYIASFGKQSLNDDNMGLVVFFRTKQLKEITKDKQNHVVVLEPDNGYVDYYFMPTWELDWEPVVTKDDFLRCIDEVLVRLNNPVSVK